MCESFRCDHGKNEKWKYDSAAQKLESLLQPGTCLTLSNGASVGGKLWTEDGAGRKWALAPPGGQMDTPALIRFNGSVEDAAVPMWTLQPVANNGMVNVAMPGVQLGFSTDFGGSGTAPLSWLAALQHSMRLGSSIGACTQDRCLTRAGSPPSPERTLPGPITPPQPARRCGRLAQR